MNSLKKYIKESVRLAINEVKESTQLTNKMIKTLYRGVNDLTSGFYKDDDWSGVNTIFDRIENIIGQEGELSVWCENGGYAKQIGEEGNYKTWKIQIELECGGIIGGEVVAHSAGTHKDPFGRYDITCSFWRE